MSYSRDEEIRHDRDVVERTVLLVSESSDVTQVSEEGILPPTLKGLDLELGETHAVKNNTGTNSDGVGQPLATMYVVQSLPAGSGLYAKDVDQPVVIETRRSLF